MAQGDHGAGDMAEAVSQAVSAVDIERVRQGYWDQNACVFFERFLPPEVVRQVLVPEVERLRPAVHRNYIPGHKKGGSISSFTLTERAPVFRNLYRSAAFMEFLGRLVGARIMPCPEDDPHACALYFYSEPGDQIGFHYDTSYYKGARYTVLPGLIQQTETCRLVAHLYKDDPKRETREIRLAYGPGDLVIFNRNTLWHAVTPLARDEERVVLTMEYVTNPEMAFHKRIFSHLKDAFAYFGISTLWRRPRSRG